MILPIALLQNPQVLLYLESAVVNCLFCEPSFLLLSLLLSLTLLYDSGSLIPPLSTPHLGISL